MIERLARWLWDRWKHRYRVVFNVVILVILLFVLLPMAVTVYGVTAHLPVVDGFLLWCVFAATTGPALWAACWVIPRRHTELIQAWGQGDRTRPEETRAAAMRAVLTTGVQVLALIGIPSVAAASIGTAIWQGTGVLGGLAMLSGATGVSVATVASIIIAFELLLRPLREEIDAAFPRPASDGVGGVGIVVRVTAGAAIAGWLCCAFGGAFASRIDSYSGRLLMAGALGFVLAPAVAWGVFRPVVLGPVLRPLEDLQRGTRRVAAGVYDKRVPVTTEDEFGELVRSFNDMQRGLLERERLHAAFGSYVDPALAQRLVAQGDDLFAGEEVEVTVFFADVRDFTGFAEQAEPRAAVERLNRLFSIVVPILRDHHGHANKFLGDGVLAVFGAPEPVDDHADEALAAALAIQRAVHDEFGESLRLGIGINTGKVIAGTVGGGGKLEFTLIGDAVNVAARVEEHTKVTGDAVLLTASTMDALRSTPATMLDRGEHAFRGKAAATRLFAVPVFDRAT